MNKLIVEDTFYLTDDGALERLQAATELSSDEVEEMVGRFRKDHYRFAGKLKGEVLLGFDGSVEIRHHFTKKNIWRSCA